MSGLFIASAKLTYSQESQETFQADPDAPFLFYSESCGACYNAISKIEEYKINDSVTINYLDIAEDVNYSYYYEIGTECEIIDEIGTPMLYHKGQCYLGVTDTVGYLLELSGIDPFETSEEPEDTSSAQDDITYPITNDNYETAEVQMEESDEADETEAQQEPWRPNFFQGFIIFAAPLTLFILAYLLIIKLNL
ncbi:hypothetical protein GF357_01625 [Candidatus Dojkabacteria bacterium]|nr:hypothetical protein [Candidatus Dojkabacteria bacterium]